MKDMFQFRWQVFKYLEEGGVLTTKQWQKRDPRMLVTYNAEKKTFVDEYNETIPEMLDLVYIEFEVTDWIPFTR